MTVIEWKTPPERPGLVLDEATRAELLDRPGQWALVRVIAGHRTHRIKTPAGFEIDRRYRRVDRRPYTEIYARAVGTGREIDDQR